MIIILPDRTKVSCDFCEHVEIMEPLSFGEIISHLKQESWRAIRDEENKKWLNKCPTCCNVIRKY